MRDDLKKRDWTKTEADLIIADGEAYFKMLLGHIDMREKDPKHRANIALSVAACIVDHAMLLLTDAANQGESKAKKRNYIINLSSVIGDALTQHAAGAFSLSLSEMLQEFSDLAATIESQRIKKGETEH